MTDATAYAVSLVLLLVGAIIVPWLAMRALVPTLESTGRGLAENYRGRSVVVGLGLVWIIWTLGLLTVGFIDSLYASLISAGGPSDLQRVRRRRPALPARAGRVRARHGG